MEKRRSAIAIFNPAAGSVHPRHLKHTLLRIARNQDVALQLRVTRYPGHASEIARNASAHHDVVIAVGGDGTVSEVISGILGTKVPVGIVPTGSTNMLSKDLRIPGRLGPAAEIALSAGAPIEIDVARINDHIVLHLAGAGYDAAIMRETPYKWKRILRWIAYLGPALRHLRSEPFKAILNIDGHVSVWRARMVLFAVGGSVIYRSVQLGEQIDRFDGVMDILVFDPPSTAATANVIAWTLVGKPSRSTWQHQFRGVCATLRADRPIPFESDGNFRGELPVAVHMIDEKVRVIAPRDRI